MGTGCLAGIMISRSRCLAAIISEVAILHTPSALPGISRARGEISSFCVSLT
ncbi:hypothetical protein X743_22675 [Mesorhizobium sp. LNHC252B00]|nr:hypothetical protein X743_22675 [Mesorhizobium sp. LNHC252B00]